MVAIRRMQSAYKLSSSLSKDESLPSPTSPQDNNNKLSSRPSQDGENTPTQSPLLITTYDAAVSPTKNYGSATPTSKDIFCYPASADKKFTDSDSDKEGQVAPQVPPCTSDERGNQSDTMDSGYEGRKSTAEVSTDEGEISTSLPTFLQELPEDLHVIEGDNVKFVVTVQDGEGVEVNWFKDSKPVELSDRVEIEVEGQRHFLVIRNVHLNDDAEYECRAKNAYGENSSFGELYIVRST